MFKSSFNSLKMYTLDCNQRYTIGIQKLIVIGWHLNGSMKEPNMFHNKETEKITRNASDAAENLQLYRIVGFFHRRSSCTTTHLLLFSERPQICDVHDDLEWMN